GAGRRDQLAAAGEVVEVFDDDIGVHDDVAIVCYQRRQFFHGVDARIFVVGLARHHGSGDEFDFVDQAEFDRGNAHLAGEWRGRGERKFHVNSSMDTRTSSVPFLTFVSCRGGFVYECQKQRDTSKYQILVWFWI